MYFVQIAIDVPLYRLFEYSWDSTVLMVKPTIGQIVEVEFGRKITSGIVIEINEQSLIQNEAKTYSIKQVLKIAPCQPIDSKELHLYQFASKYYLRPLGEVIFSSIPSEWKKPSNWERIKKSIDKKQGKKVKDEKSPKLILSFNEEQIRVISALNDLSHGQSYEILLLKGITGSGKTAVYLEWIKKITEVENKQCLILVPEINLTPQLEQTVKNICIDRKVVILHSNLTPSERNHAWLKIQAGEGQIIVGTRLSVFTPIKNLSAIVIDEEHDNSYKQQDGMRYSARDVAVWRAANLKIPVLLCSATPSLETWQKVIEKKIKLLELSKRAKQGSTIPSIEIIDIKKENKTTFFKENGITNYVIEQIRKTTERGRQALIFINRRGFAPILACDACNWKSGCKKCSTWQVLHKKTATQKKATLQCHHCGLIERVPEACPECGNQDIKPLGLGTQKIEEGIEKLFNNLRVLRIDTDATRKKGEAEELFQKVHRNEVDIIIGTQMLSKGHDFSNVETVIVIDIDKSLYSADFRATEKMYAQLVQVAGRGGRGEDSSNSKIIIQTEFPENEIFSALKNEDINLFYKQLLQERSNAHLPPYVYQALILAESKSQEKNGEALLELKKYLEEVINPSESCLIYDPIPRGIQRVGGIERTQILIESTNRAKLQKSLEKGLDYNEYLKTKNKSMRIIIERDPITF
jgi:primosomal protein N' (replication factor Y)